MDMRERSGAVDSKEKLVHFLYVLMRDHAQPGVVEKIVQETDGAPEGFRFTNGWLAGYAIDLANRIQS